jgi:hypothetical protein
MDLDAMLQGKEEQQTIYDAAFAFRLTSCFKFTTRNLLALAREADVEACTLLVWCA